MWPQTITASRFKTILGLLGAVAFSVIGGGMIRSPRSFGDLVGGWFCAAFFGLCGLVCAWLLIRPQTLRLDGDSFTLEGGLIQKPRRIPWRDIRRFYTYSLGDGVKLIGYDYVPGRGPKGGITALARSIGADGGLPKNWPMPPEAMVELLEAYRTGTYRPSEPKVVQ